MRSPVFVLIVMLVPSSALADELLERVQRRDTEILATGASVANAAGVFPIVGIGVGMSSEIPSLSWAIAGLSIGATQLLLGTLSIVRGATQDDARWLAAYGGTTVVLGLGNVFMGILNLLRSERTVHRLDFLDGV